MNLQSLLTFFALAKIATVSGAVTGSLAVTDANDKICIKGNLAGLPKSVTNGGIHVHSGKDCTNGGATDASAVNKHVGGHLFSTYIDGWAYPAAITYMTDAAGKASIKVTAKHYTLSKDKGTEAVPSVEGRCVVLHGASGNDMASRVAIGKIVKSGNSYSATIGKYPGPNPLTTTPAGKLTITMLDGDVVQLAGAVSGLGKNLKNAGIHVHTGTDCTGGSDVSTKGAVNAVVGGHLFSKGDGFLTTKYSSDDKGAGTVDIATPANAYTLLNQDATAKAPAVENHCIVIHDGSGARVGIGQIKCTGGSCAAKMGAYPKAAEAKKTTKAVIAGSLAVTYANSKVAIKGTLSGLPKSVTNAGIHVHSGEDCSNGGKTTADDVNKHVGGHLFSNNIDGWVYPAAS